MITKINIDNFKSIKSLTLVPTSLNLFMGLNAMGKSTVIQSLLLIRQSIKSDLKQLSLNGNLVEIGRGKDALYNFAETEKIHFNLNFVQGDEEKESSLSEILSPCSCGCKKLWVITYKSFLKTRTHVECNGCNKKTKSFIRKKKAIEMWNNISK